MSDRFRNYPEFHCHPQSLDSASTPEALLEKELELGTGTITATDHGTLVACRKIYDLAKDKKATKGQKITPILGCCMPGQEIHTLDGVKNIEDIQVGDLVLTHKGRFRPVVRTMRRDYDGDVFTLFEARRGSRGFTLTGEHPVLVAHQDKKPVWERADEVEAGHSLKWGKGTLRYGHNTYILLPRVRAGRCKAISVKDHLGPDFEFSGRVASKQTVNKIGGSTKWKMPRSIPLSEDLAYFLGLFAAEGSAGIDGQINLTFNITETELSRFCVSFLETLGVQAKLYERPQKGAVEVVACNVPIALLLRSLCGVGASNKKIPREIMLSTGARFKKAFLMGVIDGDGKKGGRNDLKTTSKDLAWGCRLLALNCGSMTTPKRSPVYGDKDSEAFYLCFQKDAKWRRSFWINGGGATPHTFVGNRGGGGGVWRAQGLREVIQGKYKGPVYNIEVEEDNSYVSDFIVHNCEAYLRDDNDPILQAAGIPKVFYDKGTKDAELYPNGTYREFTKYTHVTLHFQDQAAYETGVRLLSKADARAERHGSERKPLFDWAALEELGAQNVTVGSGCLIGAVPRQLLDHNNMDLARKYYERLRATFKPGNFYVEVMPHDCSTNFESGIYFTMSDGSTLKFRHDKLLRTNAGEIKAEALAAAFAKPNNEHKTLIGQSHYRVWTDLPPLDFVTIENFEGFRKNECRKWSPDGDLQKGVNRALILLAKKYGDLVVVSGDSHFATPDYKIVQDVRLAQSGSWRMSSSYHRQTSQESFEHFHRTLGTTEAEFESWVDNNRRWADGFKDFKLTNEVSLPTKFYEPNYCNHAWHKNPKIEPRDHSLMYTMELIKKHGRMEWGNPVYADRLKAEIKLLHNNGSIDLLPYFFIGEEANEVYSQAGLLTGPGRGSAAGLLLAYLLEITHVDPIKHDLSLDRFLTLDRILSGKLPDIDSDFPHRELLCDPVTGWLPTRFGDHFAQLSVDTTLKLKSAIRDVARMIRGSVPFDIEGWSRKFLMPPQGLNDFDFVMGYESDDGNYVKGSSEPGHAGFDPALGDYMVKYPEDWEIVKKCLGMARQKGRHACSFVIANKPIDSFIPMTTVSDVRVTSYTAPSVEAVGGLKIDFLVVNSLNDIGDCIKLIQSRAGVEIPATTTINNRRVPGHRLVPHNGLHDIWDLPEDPAVFKDIATGQSETVFQFGTPGAQQWMRHFGKPRKDGSYPIDSIASLAAFTALDRPGPLDILVRDPEGDGRSRHNMLVEYARRARGLEGSEDVLPIFDELVPETHGVMVFQEQLQKIYQNLTGCSGPEAEEFRTNVAKKKKEKVDAAYPNFIVKAGEKIGEANAMAAWEFFVTWAQYGFNKSHAVCYSVIGYACAYLKHHYPLEWWTSVLKNADKNEINEKFWRHCGHLIDLPDVVHSGPAFEIQGTRIRAPLSLLHGVGEAAHNQLIAGLPYADIEDFVRKQEQLRYDTGVKSFKMKKVKTKIPDPAGGKKKITIESEANVEVLKLGYSALNRGVINTLILSGSLDSLFPATTANGDKFMIMDQLQMYEDKLYQVKLELAEKYGQKKPPKPKAIDPKYHNIDEIDKFQMRKAILPAYGEDLSKMVARTQMSCLYGGDKPYYRWMPPFGRHSESVPIVDCKGLEYLSQDNYLEDGERLYAAVAAYVLEAKPFSFTKEGEAKKACKIILDVEGARFEYVKWGDKEGKIPEIFTAALTGSVVLAILNKWRSDKPFAIDDIVIIKHPLDHKEEEKEPEVQEEAA